MSQEMGADGRCSETWVTHCFFGILGLGEATIDGPTDSLAIELSWDGGKPFVERHETSGDVDPSKL